MPMTTRLTAHRPRRRIPRRRGFTALEALIAVTISGIFMAAATTFLVYMYEQVFSATEESKFNDSVRQVMGRMSEDVREAAWLHVYPSFTSTDRDAPADRRPIGNGGNCLVLVYTRSVYTTEPTHEIITRIVGYYSDNSAIRDDGTVPLRRFEVAPAAGVTWFANPAINPGAYTPSSAIVPDTSFTSIESYFSGVTSASETVIFVEQPPTDRPLFINMNTYVTIVAGTLFGNAGNNMRQTFNFSASPQG